MKIQHLHFLFVIFPKAPNPFRTLGICRVHPKPPRDASGRNKAVLQPVLRWKQNWCSLARDLRPRFGLADWWTVGLENRYLPALNSWLLPAAPLPESTS